ncbi:MAG: cytochrome P450 [Chitinophagales bacterium]|nr:cytochrome P450 [Chitinophagales bacterium]
MSTANSIAPKLAPPFPKGKHWLFGHAMYLKNRTVETITDFADTYGDLVSLAFPFNKVVIATNPEYARYILVDNNKNYHKSLAYDVLKLMLGNGLLTSEGDFWKQQRKLIQPAFHKQKLAALTKMMSDTSAALAQKFEHYAISGVYTDMLPEMTTVTLDIISKAIFSSGIDDKKAEYIGQQILALNEMAIERLNDPFKLPPVFPTAFNHKWKKIVANLDAIIYEIINQRRNEGVSKDDLLSMLLDARDEDTGEAMDNKQLRDEVMTIFLAGNETSANALTWMLYLLSQNPEAEEKMICEIDGKLDAGVELTFDNVLQFQYVRMVIDESMRLFPPAWSVGRRNYEDDTLGGYHIQKGTNVLIPIIYYHRSEKYWDEPLKFKPERFAPEVRNKIDRFVYFPFGGGPRLCIGNNFALIEMQLILIQLYRKFRFRLKPGFQVDMEPLITLKPKDGLMMKVERR